MKRLILASLAALALAAGLSPGRAVAQLPSEFNSPFGRPPQNPFGAQPFSPFLNMGRGGNAAINYYGLVRPQMQTQQQLQQLQQQQLLDQATLGGLTGLGGYPLYTGHETRFMNYGSFYPATMAGPGQRR